jgi:hypothetical protein
MLEEVRLDCPYCGEPLDLAVDCSAGDQQHYYEDCRVCCRPMRVEIRLGSDQQVSSVTARRDDD